MPKNTPFRDRSRALTRTHKIAIAGVATLGAAAVVLTTVPGGQTTTSEAAAASKPVAYSSEQLDGLQSGVSEQLASAGLQGQALQAKDKAETEAAKKKAAEAAAKKKAAEAAAKQKAAAAAAKKKAEQEREAKEAASRSAKRLTVKAVSAKTYANNLDGWIRQAMDIMAQKGIPGSYEGIHRNIMRESSGNPMAINNWDSNAAKGTPSKGLLQTIDPTFNAYHVAGTSFDPYDPVANIAAACNYAAARYGSIDNVFGAY